MEDRPLLGRRLLSATIILALLFGLIWLDLFLGDKTGHAGIIFTLIILVVAMAACDELRSMWLSRDDCPNFVVVLMGSISIVGFASAPVLWADYPADCAVGKTGWTLFGLALAVGIAFVHEMLKYDGKRNGLISSRICRTVLIFGYVGLLLSFLSFLRMFDSNSVGMFAFVSLCAIVKVSDSSAYFIGKTFGKRKITPNLSPGKTVEGTLAGLVGGVACTLVVFYFVAPFLFGISEPFELPIVILFGIAVTIAGMIGDLAESLLKRESETKDSSSWLPGLGGVLDIVDSLLVAAPVAYAFWVSGLLR